MLRIRSLVNAELIAEDKSGNEKKVQFGSGTYFEANKVEVYEEDGETLANLTLLDGYAINGVVWNQNVFENHGVPETKIVKEKNDGRKEPSSSSSRVERNLGETSEGKEEQGNDQRAEETGADSKE